MHSRGVTLLSVAVGIAIAATLVGVTVIVPQQVESTTLTGQLSQTGEEEQYNGTEVWWFAVNITIHYSSPTSLDPARFEYTLSDPNHWISVFNGSSVSTVTVRYQPDSIPNWLSVFPGGGTSGGYSGTIRGPDGTPVGLYCTGWPERECPPSGPLHGSTSIDSGAILTIYFLALTPPAGYVVTVSYVGTSGNATLALT